VRVTPRGHYKEVVLDLDVVTVRAFVGMEQPTEGDVRVRFGRALVYVDDRLRRGSPTAPAGSVAAS
jgi:hypothetical protein